VLALCAKEPQLAHCRLPPSPPSAMTAKAGSCLSAGNNANRLRRAMSRKAARKHPGDPYASAKLLALRQRRTTGSRPKLLLRDGWPTVPSEAHPERYETAAATWRWPEAPAAPEQAISHYRQALALPLHPRAELRAQLNLSALLAAPQGRRARPPCTAEQAAPQRARAGHWLLSTWG